MTYCVILSHPSDVHVNQVLLHKDDFDCKIIVIDTAEAAEKSINLQITPQKQWEGTIEGIRLNEIKSVWYRRPARPTANRPSLPKDIQRLIEAETHIIWQSMYRLLNCRFLPNPDANNYASYKLLQLKVANDLGLRIPITFITNSSSEAQYQINEYEEYCVKPISDYHAGDADNEVAFHSSRVDGKSLLQKLKDFSVSPTLIQEYIQKKYEWRITIVDKNVFPCRLNSQIIPEARDDWRLGDINDISHESIPLPEYISDILLKYMRVFNLSFGAFDLIETPDGQFVFLECNPNGQWLWIELLTGMPISQSIAAYLFG